MSKRRSSSKKAGGSFPVGTVGEISSAINLRHHGKGKSLKAPAVLRKVSRAIGQVKMSGAKRAELRAKLARARAVDRKRGRK